MIFRFHVVSFVQHGFAEDDSRNSGESLGQSSTQMTMLVVASNERLVVHEKNRVLVQILVTVG